MQICPHCGINIENYMMELYTIELNKLKEKYPDKAESLSIRDNKFKKLYNNNYYSDRAVVLRKWTLLTKKSVGEEMSQEEIHEFNTLR